MRPSEARAISVDVSGLSVLKRLGGTLFCLAFLAGGVIPLWQMALGPGWNSWRSQTWSQTPAVIESAEVAESHDSEGDTVYRIEVRYAYRFQETSFTGTRYHFGTGSTNVGVDGMRRVVATLTRQPQITCWVNLDAPAEAVLDRSLPPGFFTGILFSLPFLTVGIAGCVVMLAGPQLVRAHRRRRDAQLETLERLGVLTRPDGDGKVIFSRDEALAVALLATGINLFWNGIVGVFVSVVVIEWQGGTVVGFLMLFLTPFVTIGAMMLSAGFQAWRAVGCRKLVAVVSPKPHLGGCVVNVTLVELPMESWRPATLAARLVALAAPLKQEQTGKSLRSHVGFHTGGFRQAATPGVLQKSEHVLVAVDVPVGPGPIAVHLPPVPSPASAKPGTVWALWWQLEVKDSRHRVRSYDLGGGWTPEDWE